MPKDDLELAMRRAAHGRGPGSVGSLSPDRRRAARGRVTPTCRPASRHAWRAPGGRAAACAPPPRRAEHAKPAPGAPSTLAMTPFAARARRRARPRHGRRGPAPSGACRRAPSAAVPCATSWWFLAYHNVNSPSTPSDSHDKQNLEVVLSALLLACAGCFPVSTAALRRAAPCPDPVVTGLPDFPT
jgi:hypothetical protein